jgi:hypothetical protein
MKYYRGLLLLLFLLCVYTEAALALLWWCAGGIWVTQEFILSLPLSFHSLFYSSTNILSFGKQKRPGVLLLFYYFKGEKKRNETRQKKRMFPSLFSLILNSVVHFCGNSQTRGSSRSRERPPFFLHPRISAHLSVRLLWSRKRRSA